MVTDPSPTEIQIVLVTAPPDAATGLARSLVEERLAACVNLVPGLRSVYRWRGEILDEPETLLIVKTARTRVPELMARIPQLHPHDVPEILALSPETGLPGYLGWVLESTTAPPSPEA